MKDKSNINFIVDILMFIFMMAIGGTGFLIRYVLIPGKDRAMVYGKSVDLYFLGMDRHEWGEIHYIMSIILIVLVVLHIVLHWKMTVCMFSRLISSGTLRIVLAVGFVLLSILLLSFSFFISPEVREDSGHGGEGHSHGEHVESAEIFSIEIKGYMTFDEISEKYNVPAEYLKEKLSVDKSVGNSEKLGQIKNDYGFSMSDVEELIKNYNNEKQ